MGMGLGLVIRDLCLQLVEQTVDFNPSGDKS